MSGALNLLIGLAMGLNLLALASSRLPSVIQREFDTLDTRILTALRE